jgi:mannan endo-1,4-beta-mannosidase
VRVALASGQRWERTTPAEVAGLVQRCRENRLVCVLEVHDTTGYGEEPGAASLSQAVDFWLGVSDVLVGHEQHVIVNIGNQPRGDVGVERWAADTAEAVSRLRAAGFEHALMVDAPGWGQDRSFTMRDEAASVFAADPLGNTVFSVHMYDAYDTPAKVRNYLGAFLERRLPIVIGGFGHLHPDGDPDEDAVMSAAESLGVGYLGWSWSGNGAEAGYLDVVEGFDADRLTSWGRRLFEGPDGVAATAREATVFGAPVPATTSSSTTSTTTPPPDDAPGCSATYVVRDRWDDGFVADVTVEPRGRHRRLDRAVGLLR